MSEEIDIRQVKVATCQVCQGWVMAGCFPKSEEDDDAAREWRKCVKAGHKISVVMLTEWNTGPLSEVMCKGHKPEKVAPIAKGKSPASVKKLINTQQQISAAEHDEQNATTGWRGGSALDKPVSDTMGAAEAKYFAHLSDLSPTLLLAEWNATEEASHFEPESYKPEYVRLLLQSLGVALTPQWVSVSERLPEEARVGCKYSKHVLAFGDGGVDGPYFVAYCTLTEVWYLAHDHQPVMDVTHWMPLPVRPVEVEGINPK